MLLDFHSHSQHFQNLSLILASQSPLLSSLIDHFLPLIVPAQHHFIGNLLNFLVTECLSNQTLIFIFSIFLHHTSFSIHSTQLFKMFRHLSNC